MELRTGLIYTALIISFFAFIFSISDVTVEDINNFLTEEIANKIYCKINGDCNLNSANITGTIYATQFLLQNGTNCCGGGSPATSDKWILYNDGWLYNSSNELRYNETKLHIFLQPINITVNSLNNFSGDYNDLTNRPDSSNYVNKGFLNVYYPNRTEIDNSFNSLNNISKSYVDSSVLSNTTYTVNLITTEILERRTNDLAQNNTINTLRTNISSNNATIEILKTNISNNRIIIDSLINESSNINGTDINISKGYFNKTYIKNVSIGNKTYDINTGKRIFEWDSIWDIFIFGEDNADNCKGSATECSSVTSLGESTLLSLNKTLSFVNIGNGNFPFLLDGDYIISIGNQIGSSITKNLTYGIFIGDSTGAEINDNSTKILRIGAKFNQAGIYNYSGAVDVPRESPNDNPIWYGIFKLLSTDFIKFPIKSIMMDEDFFLYYTTLLEVFTGVDTKQDAFVINTTTGKDVRVYGIDDTKNLYLDGGMSNWNRNTEAMANMRECDDASPIFQKFRDDGMGGYWTYAMNFSHVQQEFLCSGLEVIQGYLENTNYEFCVEWSHGEVMIPCNVVWELTWTTASRGNVFPFTMTNWGVSSTGQPYEHRYVCFDLQDGSVEDISLLSNFKISRNPNDMRDTCSNLPEEERPNIYGLSMGLYFEQNTVGSSQEFIK